MPRKFFRRPDPGARGPRFKALIPFFVFAVFYLGLSICAKDFYKVPMTAAFLVASATSLLLNHREKLSNRVEVFARGMGDVNIMMMCLIFILAGAFATVAKGMGAVDAAVLISRHLIPPGFMLAGLFLVSCFISLAIGTSCGTIAAVTPIAVGLTNALHISPEVTLGAVIGGSMFGDNMSMISDTTIAATRTQGVAMRDKFIANFRMILPAAVLCLVIYLVTGKSGMQSETLPALTVRHFIIVAPYILILVLAVFGMNVMGLLFLGTVLSGVIGIFTHAFDFWTMLDLCGKGTLGMSETLIVAILAGGLLKVIRWNGGISYILVKIERPIRTSKACELGIAFLVAIVNLFTANNTVAIVITGPIARDLSRKYGCDSKRIASILDTASCIVQGMIPYGAQILIAVGVAQSAKLMVSSLGLIGSLYYPMLMALILFLSILFRKSEKSVQQNVSR